MPSPAKEEVLGLPPSPAGKPGKERPASRGLWSHVLTSGTLPVFPAWATKGRWGNRGWSSPGSAVVACTLSAHDAKALRGKPAVPLEKNGNLALC